MKKYFLFAILISEFTFSQWVLDYQFSNNNIGVTSLSVTDTNYIWFVAIDSILNRKIYKKDGMGLQIVNSTGIYRPNKLISINSEIAYLNAFDRRLYRTDNSGVNWIVIRDSVFSGYAYSIDKHNPDFIAAGKTDYDSNLSVLYTSSNKGTSWLRQNIQFTTEYNIYEVSVNDPNHIYIGMNCPDLNCSSLRYWYTLNGGGNWLIKDLPLVSNNMWLLAPVFNIQNITGFLFAPGFNVYRFRSINGGINWSSPEFFSNGNTEGMHGIQNIDSTSIWFCATSDKIFKTTNDGINWNEMTIPLNPGEFIIDFDFIKQGNKYYGYIGTDKGKIYRLIETIIPIGINPISTEIPKSFSLNQNYPNPFNPVTKIKFSLPQSGNVRLTVYDALGKEIKVLVSENLKAGIYETDFDATETPSGIYFYRIEFTDPSTPLRVTETKKMILVK